MKDTILNLTVIAAAFGAILYSAISDLGSESQTMAASAARVVEMQKTVVAAKRLPDDAVLVASASR